MTYRSHGRGTLPLRLKLRGLPRIRRQSGTTDEAVLARLKVMCRALYDQGRTDILEAIARNRLHPMAVYGRWRQGQEIEVPSADVFPALLTSWDTWMKTLGDANAKTARAAKRNLRLQPTHTLADVPGLLAGYRVRAHAAKQAPSFRLARAMCMSFLRDTVTPRHALYAAVQDIPRIPRRGLPPRKATPHTVEEIRELCALLGPTIGPMVWTMAATGMGPKEYWEYGFKVEADRVTVYGQKMEDGRRLRVVPRWTLLVPPRCHLKTFERNLGTKGKGKGKVKPYDLRACFERWCDEAGVLLTHRKFYMGHAPESMTAHYGYGEIKGQLATDAAKLAAYAGEAPPIVGLSIVKRGA